MIKLHPNSIVDSQVHTEIFFSDRPVLRVCNTREMLEKHLKATGGRVFTRFPPEPNGYLHIGHAKVIIIFNYENFRFIICFSSHNLYEDEPKIIFNPMAILQAMFVSFGLAKERDGCCYLR